jgi:Tol biopolymer transport system component
MRHIALLLLLAGHALPAHARQGCTIQVPVSKRGEQADFGASTAHIAAWGGVVVYESAASNLLRAPVPVGARVYAWDRATGSSTLVSVALDGTAPGGCSEPRVSADGRLVVYSGYPANIVPGDTNGQPDIFVRDLVAGATTRVNLSDGEAQATQWSAKPTISGDGTRVAFVGFSPGLAPGQQGGVIHVFVRDLAAGTTRCASIPAGGGAPDNSSGLARPSLSFDGRFVAFDSEASNLVSGDTNGKSDIFVRDLSTGALVRGSVAHDGAEANGASTTPSLSGDGRYLAFQSAASNLVPGDTNGVRDVFVRDLALGATIRASVDNSGQQAIRGSWSPELSETGRFLVMVSAARLDLADHDGVPDTFVRDMILQRNEWLSVRPDVEVAGWYNSGGSITADGRHAAFVSLLDNLVPDDAHGGYDVFLRDRFGCTPPVVAYCESGVAADGCRPVLSASGVPSASANSGFVIQGSNFGGARACMLVHGSAGPANTPFGVGGGTLCVAGRLQRTPLFWTSGTPGQCDGAFALDWNQLRAALPLGASLPLVAGQRVWLQAYERFPGDPAGPLMSHGLHFALAP